MSDQSIVRRALLSDAADISALIHSLSHYRSPDATEPAPKEFLAGFAADTIAESISSGSISYWVALARGVLVGVIGVSDERRVHHLFVKESSHREGIARALWETVQAHVLTSIAVGEEVEILVRSSEYAVPVYERFGFTACGPRADGTGVTHVPMRRFLRRFREE